MVGIPTAFLQCIPMLHSSRAVRWLLCPSVSFQVYEAICQALLHKSPQMVNLQHNIARFLKHCQNLMREAVIGYFTMSTWTPKAFHYVLSALAKSSNLCVLKLFRMREFKNRLAYNIVTCVTFDLNLLVLCWASLTDFLPIWVFLNINQLYLYFNSLLHTRLGKAATKAPFSASDQK